MRWISLFFGIIFTLFVIVQYNDPDALLWIAVYGAAALLSLVRFLQKRWFLYGIFVAAELLITFIWSVSLWHAIDADWIDVEEAREAFGLLIITFWMGILLYDWLRTGRGDGAGV